MKNLRAISHKIAKELIKKQSTLYCYFPEKYQKIAKKILSDYEYIYDPEHKKNPGGGYERTEEGWSKGGEDKRKKTNVDNFLRKNPKLKYNFNRILKILFESNIDYHKLPKDSKMKIFNTINFSVKKHGGKKISVKDFENIYDKLKEDFVEKSKKTEKRKEKIKEEKIERKVKEQKKKDKIERKDTEEKKELKEIERKVKEQKKKEDEKKRKLEEERKKEEESEKKRNDVVSYSISESNQDYDEIFAETNRKLRDNGFSEMEEHEFRKKFNNIKFPLIEKSNYEYYFMTDKEVEVFCHKNIAENSRFKGKNKKQTVNILNAIQSIKREFPDLHKTHINAIGTNLLQEFHDISEEVQESMWACVYNKGEGINFCEEIFSSNSFSKKPFHDDGSGNTFQMGHNATTIGGSSEFAKMTAFHEMAHLTKYNLEKQDKEKYQKIESKINELFEDSKNNGDIFKLSFYSSTSPEEFWAEIFAVYYYEKNKLPQNILTKLEDIISEMKK